ncbi:PD-(D/E)XK motif protein [Streptomyces sp. NPDC088732]|uniref:PD-(D/E)XK motif protein n=1 Tax=Streptomyces sp. NPDC088732 TaxID=3365879 RepID=UPI003810B884
MNDDMLRAMVEERWGALGEEPATGESRLRISQLPVDTTYGSLAVAVDHEGHRHVLVPIQGHSKVRGGLDGPVLFLRKRALEDEETYQTYADLGCLQDDLSDLFTDLCVDVLSAIVELRGNPIKALYGVLDRWRALFRTHGAPLGAEQLAGLFGELVVLERLLRIDSSAHRIWHGPEGHRHDFSAGSVAIEVKSTAATAGRRPRIHGLDQLEAPEGGSLCLTWFRLRPAAPTEKGSAVPDLVERILKLCDDEPALLELLGAAGYRASDADRYREVRFLVGEERWYRVDTHFPALTRQTFSTAVPVSVLDVEYSVDLSGDVPAPMERFQVAETIEALIQESA